MINLIKRHKLYSRKINKGDSSVTKALLRMKGHLKLIKNVLYRKTILDNSPEKKNEVSTHSAQSLDYKGIEGLSQSSRSSRNSKDTQPFK